MKNKSFRVVILVLLVAIAFSSCSTRLITESADKVTGNYDFYDSYYSSDEDLKYGMDGMNSAPKESASSSISASTSNDLENRKIIKTANINFQTKSYDEFMNSLNACIFTYGGYVQTSESNGGGVYQTNYSRSAYVTIRIPETYYESFMSAICTLGSVTFKSEDTKDVTIAYVDTESRIKALETEYNALLDILEKATKLDDVIQLQSRLSEVTYQLETYKSQLRKYDDLISYCTVSLNVYEVKKEVVNEERMTLGERISNEFGDTLEDIKEDFEDFSVWFISSIPYILIWAAIITIAVIIIKKSIKKHKNKIIAKANDIKKPNDEENK